MNKLVSALKALPLIRFALMLGGGVAATISAGFITSWLTWSRFPDVESVWLARIQAVAAMGLASMGLAAVVMITLAWGKVGKVTATVGGNTVDLDFEDGPEQGTTTTVTTEVKS